MSLTSVSNVKSWAGISGDSDNTLIESLIAACDEHVKALLLGRVLESAEYVEKLDGTGFDFLTLSQRPVTEVAEVKIDADRGFGSGIEALASDEYDLDADTGMLYRVAATWPFGRRNIRVTYTAGYATVPADVTQAANEIVAEWYVRAKQLKSGQSQAEVASENVGYESQTYVQQTSDWGIPDLAKSKLLKYARKYA